MNSQEFHQLTREGHYRCIPTIRGQWSILFHWFFTFSCSDFMYPKRKDCTFQVSSVRFRLCCQVVQQPLPGSGEGRKTMWWGGGKEYQVTPTTPRSVRSVLFPFLCIVKGNSFQGFSMNCEDKCRVLGLECIGLGRGLSDLLQT